MPAKKHKALSSRHDAAADRETRIAAESALAPELSGRVPPELFNRPTAQKVWKRVISMWSNVEGGDQIITGFDQDLLTIYCLALDEAYVELPRLKTEAWDAYRLLKNKLKTVDDEKALLEITRQMVAMLKEIKGIDSRLDVKRSHLHKYLQSLYMTPRSRAGVAPPEKAPEEPESELERIMKGT